MNLNRNRLKQLMYGMHETQDVLIHTHLLRQAANQAAVSPPEPKPIEPTPVDPFDPTDPEEPAKPIQPSDPIEPTHPQAQPGYLDTPAIGNDTDSNELFDSAGDVANFERPDSMKFFIIS